ncbi:hypothetical protein EVG20_g3927 [Dentipellis fragilis]|uniref:Uncharacterized protein n=1 Tax=Dentipellis fragilis TaxID=205917 RepID=A0A4Y9Z281_9AGAM|nr:hypothetical protein EVG20_g3927 [Dentipellis fragilis]
MASNNKGTYNTGGAPKYINDFSKALAGEVRILLQEVGKLRDERRALQHQCHAKHQPPQEPLPDVSPPPPPPPEVLDGPSAPARPAWRTVNKRPERKHKSKAPATPAPPPPAQLMPPEPPKPDLPSWAQWRPNPLLAPQARAPTPSQAVVQAPVRAGLFGPTTPPPQ